MNEPAEEPEATASAPEDAASSFAPAEPKGSSRKRGRSRGKPADPESAAVMTSSGADESRAEGSTEEPTQDEPAPPEPTDAEIEAAAIAAQADDPDATLAHDADGEPAEAQGDEPVAEERARNDAELAQAIEAMLFATSEPLTHGRLAQVLKVSQRRVRTAIERLREDYQATHRAFDVLEIAGGFKLYTRPEHDEIVALLEKVKPPEKLTAAGLETLAIIAYKQPITRAEIDAIRGVQSGAMLKSLTERKLIRVAGRSPQPGRPIQYGTTKRFLDHFGLASVEDLPRVEDLKAP